MKNRVFVRSMCLFNGGNRNLRKNKIHEGNLILVNPTYPLQRGGINRLVPASTDYHYILLRRDTTSILQTILEKISAEQQIMPVSGYRSVEKQTEIYNDSLKKNGAEFTKKFVALPGHSEHQTGMAIDLGLYSDKIDFICPDFPYDSACEVFRETASSYGFVERYPADKEKLRGIAHEPWHFRYVGFPHSAIMTGKSLTLEEYSDFIKNYTSEHPLIYNDIEIYYIHAAAPRIFLHNTDKFRAEHILRAVGIVHTIMRFPLSMSIRTTHLHPPFPASSIKAARTYLAAGIRYAWSPTLHKRL